MMARLWFGFQLGLNSCNIDKASWGRNRWLGESLDFDSSSHPVGPPVAGYPGMLRFLLAVVTVPLSAEQVYA